MMDFLIIPVSLFILLFVMVLVKLLRAKNSSEIQLNLFMLALIMIMLINIYAAEYLKYENLGMLNLALLLLNLVILLCLGKMEEENTTN